MQRGVDRHAYSPLPPPRILAQTFREVLKEWGFDWMWADLQLTGDNTWICEAIRDNLLVAVTVPAYELMRIHLGMLQRKGQDHRCISGKVYGSMCI
jgi:hypothetical protein